MENLRVWHIPQVPMQINFKVPVKNVEEAKKIINVLADYDLFQYENKIKPDYSNASGLEEYENGEWAEWYSPGTGNDIWEEIRFDEEQGKEK